MLFCRNPNMYLSEQPQDIRHAQNFFAEKADMPYAIFIE